MTRTHMYVNKIMLSISNSLVILEHNVVYLCMGTWPVYGNPTLGLFLNHSRSSWTKRGKEESQREREREKQRREEHYLIATCLTPRARYTTRSNDELLKGIFLCNIENHIFRFVMNRLTTRAFSIPRTDSLAKPRRESEPKGRGLCKWQRQAFPSSLIAITPGRLTVYETSLRKGAAIRTPRDNGVPMHKGIRRSPVNNVRMYIATRLRYLRGNAASLRKLTNRSAGRRVNQNQLST